MKISIITPTYNREDCIIRCLDSVTVQLPDLPSDVEVEHIVVDDGSGDSSATLINSYAVAHTHVKPILFPHNRGVAAARNAAVRAATGNWCLLLDSDDRQTSDALMIISETIKQSPDYRHYMFTVDDRKSELSELGESRVFTFDDFLSDKVQGDFVHVISRDVMRDHPFDERLRIYEHNTFLSFYKEVHFMLFSNVVVQLIERNRGDSVSRTCVRYNDEIIGRRRLCAQHKLANYEKDYREHGLENIIGDLHFEIADNSLLLYDYQTAREHLPLCNKSYMKTLLTIVATTHLVWLYKWMLQRYLAFRHRRPTRGVQ